MPRPEQTPVARFKGLPYGANALANAGMDAADDFEEPVDESFDELEDFAPASPEEEFLFSPSDRPNEPLTAGMSFGAGPNVASSLVEGETRTAFADRVQRQLEMEGENTPGMRKFLAAARRGL